MALRKGKKETFSKCDLEALTKEELVGHVLQLQAHNIQLKNIIKKQSNQEYGSLTSGGTKDVRKFDFSKHHKRHILLRILYLGWDYQGYATQDDTTNTIEYHLFAALEKACLIEKRETSNYHRCGRTDKGVSSFGQVISIDVRSRLSEDHSLDTDISKELPYCKVLNRLLPDGIKAVAWRPAQPGFSARFDCCERTYKYYFPRGNLNIQAMEEASKNLIGSHDFRNLCKMDVGNGVLNYVREIKSLNIEVFKKSEEAADSGYDLMVLKLVGSAFLWHQVRCLMGILLLVGQGYEQPVVVQQLLDIETHPRKPQYSLASDVPLNLFKCRYPFDDLDWLVDEESIAQVQRSLQRSWTFQSVKAAMIQDMLLEVSKFTQGSNPYEHSSCLLQGVKSKVYKPLMTRATCESLASRIEHYSKKRKLDSLEVDSSSCMVDSPLTESKADEAIKMQTSECKNELLS